MMAKKKITTFNVSVNDSLGSTDLKASALFDKTFVEANTSPIDTFFTKTLDLTKLVIDPATFSPVIANLVLLGYISAMESYFRELIRKLIIIDKDSRKSCESQLVTYAAACVHDQNMLPEALLEDFSFASRENIIKAFKELLGFKRHTPSELNEALVEFSSICQLRHCLVHRFGRLGSKNAMKLGLLEDLDILEKPIVFNYNTLQEALSVCQNTVKAVNGTLFTLIMMRLIVDPDGKRRSNTVWLWNYAKDRKLFNTYFRLFLSLKNPPADVDARNAYNVYRSYYQSLK